MTANIAETIKFSDVVSLLEKIKTSKAIHQKEIYLRKFIEYYYETKKKLGLNTVNSDSNSFYCILRLLLPNTDERTYGIKTITMGKIYVKILGLAPDGEDAKKLMYKSESQVFQGDFAEIAFNVLKSRPNSGCNYSLKQLHELLDKIAFNDRTVVEMELTKYFEIATALEQKWLIRIVFKRLHLGIGEQKIFSIYDPRARPLYMKLTKLSKVCEMIESGNHIDLDTVEVELFQHIKAMLCQKIQATKFQQLFLSSNYYYMETKMDGERFQLHMKNGKFKYFSRNGIDYTKSFGETETEGYLTPNLSKCLNSSVEAVIMDGEMMVWSKSKQTFCVKGENFDVKHLRSGRDLNACFVVFDILYLNDSSYFDRPYLERRNKLQEIIKIKTGVIQLCKKNIVYNLEEFVEKFNEAMNANEEGIVLKDPTSTYKPGIRGAGWFKLKPDYVNDVIADLCFIIMGVISDRTNNRFNNYLLGAMNKNEADPSNSTVYSVSTINSGLSVVGREKLNETIRPYLVKDKPEMFKVGKLLADLWLPLQNTVLMDVTATELNKSEDFKTNFTLRFPRILSIRTDKVWLESTSVQEFDSITEENERVRKIYKRNIDAKDFTPAKKMKLLADNPYKSNFNACEVQHQTSIFENYEFCILSGSEDGKYSIEDLKTIILQHKGRIVENPTNNCICITGKLGFRAKKVCQMGKNNIIKFSWLVDNFSNNKNAKFCRPKPRYMLFETEKMKKNQRKYFDKYGDSYTDPVDEKELKILFNDMEDAPILSSQELENVKVELDP